MTSETFPPNSCTCTVLPAAMISVPSFDAFIVPVLRTQRPTRASFSPDISPALAAKPFRPVNRSMPALKSAVLMLPAAAKSAPTFVTEPDWKMMPDGFTRYT